MANWNTKNGYFAIDIERTGPHLTKDKTFAIGYAFSDGYDVIHYDGIEKGQILINLGLDLDYELIENMNFEEKVQYIRPKWIEKGFDMKCFDEFWASSRNTNNIDVLISLQKQSDPTIKNDVNHLNIICTEFKAGGCIDDALQEAEQYFEKITIITDTVSFDTTHVNFLLFRENLQPLNYSRDGSRYQSGVEVDSFAMGALQLPIDTDWQKYDDEYNAKIDPVIAHLHCEHDHQPINDAQNILIKFLKTQKYLKQLNKQNL